MYCSFPSWAGNRICTTSRWRGAGLNNPALSGNLPSGSRGNRSERIEQLRLSWCSWVDVVWSYLNFRWHIWNSYCPFRTVVDRTFQHLLHQMSCRKNWHVSAYSMQIVWWVRHRIRNSLRLPFSSATVQQLFLLVSLRYLDCHPSAVSAQCLQRWTRSGHRIWRVSTRSRACPFRDLRDWLISKSASVFPL